MAVGDILGKLSFGQGGGMINLVYTILICIGALAIIGGILYFIYKKKAWNLKVEVKIPRGLNDLNPDEEINPDEIEGFVGAEWGKGRFSAKQGVCWIKRKWMAKSPIKPFDIKKFVQGGNTLTVIQVSADKYSPIYPSSFIKVTDSRTGEEGALLKMKIDTSESKAWRNQFEREAKSTYSIMNLLREYAPYISIGLVIVLWGLQFMILYTKVS